MSPICPARPSIQNFPNEILAIVIEFAVSNAQPNCVRFRIGGKLPAPLVLMRVNKVWRGVCISLKALWQDICINIAPNPRIMPVHNASVWNQFAKACEDALQWGRPKPLRLRLKNWHTSKESYQSVRHPGSEPEVTDGMTLGHRTLRLAIDESHRWEAFTMQGPDSTYANDTEIPWSSLLEVTNRIPMLEQISLLDLCCVPPPNYLWQNCKDIFLVAPKLSSAKFGANAIPFNLPWPQLITTDVSSTNFETYRELADYFFDVMTQVAVTTISWGDTNSFIPDVDGILSTLPTAENSHIVKLHLGAIVLPPVILPNLDTLRFMIGDTEDRDIQSVARVESLLHDSKCHLVELTVDQYLWDGSYTGDVNSLPLLPYLNTLRFLTWEAALQNDDTANVLVRGLRNILVGTPSNLPNLNTLFINLTQTESARVVRNCDFEQSDVNALWNIICTRMLGDEAVLKTFHITVAYFGSEPIHIKKPGYLVSDSGANIQQAVDEGVDFKFSLAAVWRQRESDST